MISPGYLVFNNDLHKSYFGLCTIHDPFDIGYMTDDDDKTKYNRKGHEQKIL